MAIKLEDFLPKSVDIEYKGGKITLREPTIEDLIKIQKISVDIEKGQVNEIEGAIKILTLLADKNKQEEFEKMLRQLPYSRLIFFQNKVFKELGLVVNEVENETKNE